jgi:WhiB family redox-sensing transcriptional regulator
MPRLVWLCNSTGGHHELSDQQFMDQRWREAAACRTEPVETFYPPAEHDGHEAKAICLRCSVREICLEYAIASGERFGVWGGLTPQERRWLVAKSKRTPLVASEAPRL